MENILMGLVKVKNVLDITADTVADLANVQHKTGSLQLLGFHTKGDGGGGVFFWDATKDKSEHNGGTVIDPDKAGLVANWATTQSLYFSPEVTGQGCWVREYSGAVNVKWFGAKGDGVSDDTDSIQNAVNIGIDVFFPKGLYKCTDTITVNSAMTLKGGDNSFDVIIRFFGTGSKSVRTYVTHPNDGTDSPLSVGVDIKAASVSLENIIIDLNTDYTNTSPSNLGDDWDVGILVNQPYFRMKQARVRGYWRDSGIRLNGTLDNGNCDGVSLYDVRTQGKFGLSLQGAELESGQTEIQVGDDRGAGGISDFQAYNCYFESYNHHSGTRPDDVNGGCLYSSGKIRAGTSSMDAIQGHVFYGCRFYSYDPTPIKLKASIRDQFVNCFIERITGKFQSDGVTSAGDTDVIITSSPTETKNLRLFGTDIYRISNQFSRTLGFYLEQTSDHNLTRPAARSEGLHEFPDGVKLGAAGNTALTYYNQGVFTPSFGFVTATYTSRVGNYTRIGNMVFAELDIDCSSLDNTDTSSLQIAGLPFISDSHEGHVIGNISYESTLLNTVAEPLMFKITTSNLRLLKNNGSELAYNDGSFKTNGTLKITLTYMIL
jgi:hypothetical protein